eukprot:31502-Pelagococcus_subviridis.AAC.30
MPFPRAGGATATSLTYGKSSGALGCSNSAPNRFPPGNDTSATPTSRPPIFATMRRRSLDSKTPSFRPLNTLSLCSASSRSLAR